MSLVFVQTAEYSLDESVSVLLRESLAGVVCFRAFRDSCQLKFSVLGLQFA